MTASMHWSERLKSFMPELLELRRYLHAHPELSGEEHQTAALIAGELRSSGWEVKEGFGKTGVLAELGSTSGPVVGLRVDMDALPIEELTGLSYASKRQGVMHACGHDIHTCIGLGVAKLLTQEKLSFGRVRLLFQPAEELAKGADWMRKAGATDRLEALFGVHVFPELSVGQIGVRRGSLTAAAGELEIEIIGEGGHGARPHQSVDAIWIAARVITGIQEAISRCLDPLHPVVVSFGKIKGGKAFNVIADRVKLTGTVRYLDPASHEKLPTWLEETVQAIATSLGARAVVKYKCIAPPVYNNSVLTDLLERSAVALIGAEKVIQLETPSLGAEDFAEFLQDVPGTMFRLGVAGEQGCAPLHNGHFSPDESSLQIGIEVLTNTILNWLDERSEID